MPSNAIDHSVLGPTLPVDLEAFALAEVIVVLRKLRSAKAAGPDGIPAEYLKLLLSCTPALLILTNFLNCCWQRREVPHDWHLAFVTAVYKKGSVEHCENYRPISLLSIGYKIFASLIHKRLQKAGAEDRLSKTQFGFRTDHSTTDAIFILRRRIELAWAQREGSTIVLALDWAKAFDSVDPQAMLVALRRFGLPEHVIDVAGVVYSQRRFQVRDCGSISEQRVQASAILQGSPLSHFLFVMLMSVIMYDATEKLTDPDKRLLKNGRLADLLYADDTLLLGVDAGSMQRFVAAVAEAGACFGLRLHWGKIQQINVRCEVVLHLPDGTDSSPKEAMTYLGSIITNDGRAKPELIRRLGAARAAFRELARLWRHSALGRLRKLEIFNAIVRSRVLYGLCTFVLNVSERRKLDGFQNRCLREIWGIKSAYLSRVSNASVLQTTGQKPLTCTLAKQQLLLYGRVARQPDGSPMRNCTFCPGSLRPATDRYVRNVGRPRLEWATEVGKLARNLCKTPLEEAVSCRSGWEKLVEDS
jgi:hypothetical protein